MTQHRTASIARVPGLLLAVAAVLIAAVVPMGFSPVALWLTSLVAIFCLLLRRLSMSMALGLAVVAFFAGELVLLKTVPLLGADLLITEVVVWTLVSLSAGVTVAVAPATATRLSRRDVWLGVAACTGAFFLFVSIAAAQVLPGALRLAWAMNGDAINVLGFARRMLADTGIDATSTPQPTPLPFAMIASNLASGRSSLADAAVLEHDVGRFAQVWVFIIAISCVLAGAIVARAVRDIASSFALIPVAAASIAGLSWFVVGVQLQFGFINSAYAIMILLTSWLIYSSGERSPALTLTGLFLAGTVTLAVWSPLVACVAALGAVSLFRGRLSIRAADRGHRVLLISAFLVFTGYIVTVTLPDVLRNVEHLSGDGGFPNIGPVSALTIVLVTGLIASIAAGTIGMTHAASGALAVVVAFGVSEAYLLLQRWNEPAFWGYYPAKYAWTASILLLVIAFAFAINFLKRFLPRTFWKLPVAVMTIALFASFLWSPASGQRPNAQAPILGILQGNAFGLSNSIAERVFALSGSENGQDVVWRTQEGDFWANFWLLQIDIPDRDDNPVRTFAHYTDVLDPGQMCQIVTLLGDGAVVHTPDPLAEGDLSAACPTAEFVVMLSE